MAWPPAGRLRSSSRSQDLLNASNSLLCSAQCSNSLLEAKLAVQRFSAESSVSATHSTHSRKFALRALEIIGDSDVNEKAVEKIGPREQRGAMPVQKVGFNREASRQAEFAEHAGLKKVSTSADEAG